jgi:hypothetical protein
VYQYEPPGQGSCTTSRATFSGRSEGCVNLISSGTSNEESVFLEASESGGEVFFLTTAKLATQDYDTSFDIYDARECTAQSPCAAPSVEAPPACTTPEACRAPLEPQPAIFGAPPSQTFSGAGNIVPEKIVKKAVKCKKGFVKNKNKCVRKKTKKKIKKARKSSKASRWGKS